jgi:uncharacterized cofD-like protein
MHTPISINSATRRSRGATPAVRIVAIGGGTGLPVLLRGLARSANLDITAIVATSDDGGSSGRLRDSLGVPAVGDLRNCLAALARAHSPLSVLLQHRFCGGALEGHALGNLILAALHQKMGSLTRSSAVAAQMLGVKGRALAVTETPVTLCARFAGGSKVRGESRIPGIRKPIDKVWLEPKAPPAGPGVLEAIHSADAIVLAPGSLYTSLIPNLLVGGVADAIRHSDAVKILVCNLTTQPGETDGFPASAHLRAVENWLGRRSVDFCVVHSPGARSKPDPQVVICDSEQISRMGAIPVVEDLLVSGSESVRHDARRLARVVLSIARTRVLQQRRKQESLGGEASHVSSNTRTVQEIGSGDDSVGALRVVSGAGSGHH